MSSPTKADLTAAVAKLTKENKGLRDLLAAVSLVADTVPVAAAGVPDWRELRRSAHVLSAVKVVANPAGSWAWGHATGHAAKHLREIAAEPVGYEVFEPDPEDCGHPLTDGNGQAYGCGRPPHGPEYAHEAWTADGTRVLDPAAVLAEPAASGAPVAAGDEGAPAGPCPACHYGPDGTRLPCTLTHQYGAYGVADVSHMDADGTVFVVLRCRCGHPQDEHGDADDSDAGPALHECLHPACACAAFRLAAVSVTA